jgi:hypothetical protein
MRQLLAQLNGMVSQIRETNSGYILDFFSRICPTETAAQINR